MSIFPSSSVARHSQATVALLLLRSAVQGVLGRLAGSSRPDGALPDAEGEGAGGEASGQVQEAMAAVEAIQDQVGATELAGCERQCWHTLGGVGWCSWPMFSVLAGHAMGLSLCDFAH